MRADPEKLKELSRYTKEEIIEALGRQWQANGIIDDMINYLNRKLLEQAQTAYEASLKARQALIDWNREMVKMYGDGSKVKFAYIPAREIERGAALEKAVNRAEEKEREFDRKIDRMLRRMK